MLSRCCFTRGFFFRVSWRLLSGKWVEAAVAAAAAANVGTSSPADDGACRSSTRVIRTHDVFEATTPGRQSLPSRAPNSTAFDKKKKIIIKHNFGLRSTDRPPEHGTDTDANAISDGGRDTTTRRVGLSLIPAHDSRRTPLRSSVRVKCRTRCCRHASAAAVCSSRFPSFWRSPRSRASRPPACRRLRRRRRRCRPGATSPRRTLAAASDDSSRRSNRVTR